MTDKIPCIFIERKWMRAAKAWRCFLELPDTPQLASVITAYIESKMAIDFEASGLELTIDPMFIVDVQSKGKRFYLVVETAFESQAHHGPLLTALTGMPTKVTIRPENTEHKPVFEKKRGTIDQRTLKGLHSAFFKNPKFWDYIIAKTGAYIKDDVACKDVFKSYMGVGSCTEINQEGFDEFLKEFNAWLNGAKSV